MGKVQPNTQNKKQGFTKPISKAHQNLSPNQRNSLQKQSSNRIKKTKVSQATQRAANQGSFPRLFPQTQPLTLIKAQTKKQQPAYSQVRKTRTQKFLEQKVQVQHGNENRRVKNNQNLKNISHFIKLLINYNQNLTTKSLSYLLYEIIGETNLGIQIRDKNYLAIQPQALKDLHKKYVDESKTTQKQGKIIKNVRRRLYDALNVMISAKIISRRHNDILKILNDSQTNRIRENSKDENNQVAKLNKKVQQLTEKVAQKRKLVEQTKMIHFALQKLAQRTNHEKSTEPQYCLPMVVIRWDPNTIKLTETQGNKITLKNKKQFQMYADRQILSSLFKSNTAEIK